MTMHQVIHGDSLDVLRGMDDNSIDAIVTDPPAGISFMNSHWDRDKGGRDQWIAWMAEVAAECLRVIKPGGHALVWAIPRTSHWTGMAWEQAGWEPRDKVYHAFGSGFPKSLDVSKAIDKANGRRFDDRFALGQHIRKRREACGFTRAEVNEWLDAKTKIEHYESESYGFARVPTLSDWYVLKERLSLSDEWLPLVERAEAEREVVGQQYGTQLAIAPGQNNDRSAITLNITAPATPAAQQWDGWGTALKPAVEEWWLFRKPLVGTVAANVLAHGTGALNIDACRVGDDVVGWSGGRGGSDDPTQSMGRNYRMAAGEARPVVGRWPANLVHDGSEEIADGLGHAARFYYVAKASRRERDAGLDDSRNHHATVKPIALMEWLIKLVTPPGGVVLDPFAGSGTTGCAAARLGVRSILVEREAEYVEIARRRVAYWSAELDAAAD